MNARSVRVLHVINGLGTGGAERSLAEMLPLLDEAGVQSTIACLARKPEGVHASVEAAGYDVQVVGPARLRALRRLRALIDQRRVDVVHTAIFDADVLGRVAAAGKRCAVLSSLVNTTYDGVRRADAGIGATKLAAVRAVDAVTARRLTDHFHAISGAVRDSAATHLGIAPERITVVERGRDTVRLGVASTERRRRVRAALAIPADAEVVLNVGRQEPQKDQATLLRAWSLLARTRPRLMLLQAGRAGKATAELRRLAADCGAVERVRFLGHRDDVPDLLAASDVFAFPSIYEGLGGSLLEAMALGVPSVITDVPALVEVAERGCGALVVPVREPAALARALERLLTDHRYADELSHAGQRIFRERFALGRSAQRMADLYAELVTERVNG